MIPYKKFRYIYPPRPENKVPLENLSEYDNGRHFGQPKLNGSNLTIYTNGVEVFLMNRHKDTLSNIKIDKQVFLDLHRGEGWMAINGEYMNKNKKDGNGEPFNHKFVIFDILVYNGRQTVGKTFKERKVLLNGLYETETYDHFIEKINSKVYIVKDFFSKFVSVYTKLIKIDMYEGLVLKLSNSKLKNGVSQKNNTEAQIKVRKETKNYNY